MLRRGFLWIAIYQAAVLIPLAIVFSGDLPPGQSFWIEFSIALGFLGMAMIVWQFLITARIRPFTRPFGIDIVLQFHRRLAYLALTFVIVHPLIILLERGNWGLLNIFDTTWAARFGISAVLLLIAIAATSAWRLQLRLSYEAWHVTHAVLAVGIIVLSYSHMFLAGSYLETGWKQIIWGAMAASVLLVLAYTRVVKPLLQWRRPYRVVAVKPERGDSYTIELEPEGHEGISFQAGQFAWIKVGTSPFAFTEHPFSFSAAPDSGTLQFTIKELGDFTGEIKDIPAGTRAYIDGPYGAFTFQRFDAPGYVFIAGGIGITPIMSMLQKLAEDRDGRPLLLINANQRWEEVTYREEFPKLEQLLNLQVVHVLAEPHDGWDGETGYVTKDLLDRHLPPNRHDLQYFLCGPPVMLEAVRDALRELGIPLRHIQLEEFALV